MRESSHLAIEAYRCLSVVIIRGSAACHTGSPDGKRKAGCQAPGDVNESTGENHSPPQLRNSCPNYEWPIEYNPRRVRLFTDSYHPGCRFNVAKFPALLARRAAEHIKK